MYIDLNTKTKSLGGLSDLTVMAPIKKGLVPSLDSITYKSRLRRLMEALQALRATSHEYSLFRSISDSAERVGRIHSFRVAIIEPEDKLLLAVTYDGAREAYIRVLWQKIGTLLDLLFCNTEGHVPAYGNSLADWDAWIDRIQVKTDFFYGRPRLTSDDVLFLRDEEQERCRNGAKFEAGFAAVDGAAQTARTAAYELAHRKGQGAEADPESVQRATRAADDAARELVRLKGTVLEADAASVRRATRGAEAIAWDLAKGSFKQIAETSRQGVQTIALLHRLTAWFVPDTPDGNFLHRAARDLLPEFAHLCQSTTLPDQALDEARIRFPEQIDWFLRPYPRGAVPPAPTAAPDAAIKAKIQGGILDAYQQVTHGALLLLAFKPDGGKAPFWNMVNALRTAADAQPVDGSLVCNVAFTHEGLRAAGLREDELAAFPPEFREGMEARCSVLGDVRTNHPRRWRLPLRNWNAGARQGEAVELAAVHVVLQLRGGNPKDWPPEDRIYDLTNNKHPLRTDIDKIATAVGGCMELLSMEPMVRHLVDPKDKNSKVQEHFGFADGKGQPLLDPANGNKVYKDNLVQTGEFLVGHANAGDPAAGDGQPKVSSWLLDGSFLVIRKLSQDVALFNQIVRKGAEQTGLGEDDVAARMMGRSKNGTSLIAVPSKNKNENDFDYQLDPQGVQCPLHAHIRRANPRAAQAADPPPLPGGRPPRIMRRSMSFGPRFEPSKGDRESPDGQSRGMFFMAYNARIGEQFEVVQRWLSGGNSTGGYSGRSDPFVGVPASGQWRMFSFECAAPHAGGPSAHHIKLDGSDDPAALASTMVRLDWGAYLFTPSLDALRKLGKRAASRVRQWPWSAARGRVEIDRLLSLPASETDRMSAWKAALEDPEAQKSYLSASIWAAIRSDFQGVLRTPYGVLAASHEHAMAVLRDAQGCYSVKGYRERCAPTLGDIYLGLDDRGAGCPYRQKSEEPNKEIQSIDEQSAFGLARQLARKALDELIKREKNYAEARAEADWQLTFGAKEVWDEVLKGLCREWFGLPGPGESLLIEPSAFRWDWDPRSAVLYPGNFLAPSRYIFQPRPGAEVLRVGSMHGTTTHAAFVAWVKKLRDEGTAQPKAPNGGDALLAKAIFDAFPRRGDAMENAERDTLVAETLLGALIGFLPTVEGNLRQSLNEWLLDGTFWSLRAALKKKPGATDFDDAAPIRSALRRSMQLRPSPEVVWRRATKAHDLGPERIEIDDVVVVAIVSATHELLARGKDDVWPIFGGDRTLPERPTHACPGYKAAMGTLLGILTALLETGESLRPAPSPLSFRMEGPSFRVKAAAEPQVSRSATAAPGSGRVGDDRVLLVAGDSWFDYPGPGHADLGSTLKSAHGFQVVKLAQAGKRLARLAANDLDPLCERFERLANDGQRPDAILISAGGNDVVGQTLLEYVLPSSGKLDDEAMKRLMDGDPNGAMRKDICKILDGLKQRCRNEKDEPVPVVWQGYDYPVPDGRTVFGGSAPGGDLTVLYRYLIKQDYQTPQQQFDVMKKVVERYNKLLANLSKDLYKGHLFHADLRGTLECSLDNDAYKRDWENEMHATPAGFAKLADRLVQKFLLPALTRTS